MIQRIQSIYLFVAALVLAVALFVPYAVFGGEFGSAHFSILKGVTQRADGLRIVDDPYLVAIIMVSINILMLLVSIFLFKNRKAQIALVYTSLFSILASLGSLVYHTYALMQYYMSSNTALHYEAVSSFGLYLPILAFAFAWLAARAIKKDDELVRSADRIR